MRLTVCMVAAILLASCDDNSLGLCGSELAASAPSPDGKYIATITIVDCGATTMWASWIAIRPTKNRYKPRAEPVAVFEGRLNQLSWEGHDLVVVHHGERVSKMEPQWHDVHVNYHQISK